MRNDGRGSLFSTASSAKQNTPSIGDDFPDGGRIHRARGSFSPHRSLTLVGIRTVYSI